MVDTTSFDVFRKGAGFYANGVQHVQRIRCLSRHRKPRSRPEVKPRRISGQERQIFSVTCVTTNLPPDHPTTERTPGRNKGFAVLKRMLSSCRPTQTILGCVPVEASGCLPNLVIYLAAKCRAKERTAVPNS